MPFTPYKGAATAPKTQASAPSGGFFSNLARGIAKTPLKFAGTGYSALEAAGQFATGQFGKAHETIEKGSEKVRETEKALGYEEGDISTPYSVAEKVEIKDGEKTGGQFGKKTLEMMGAGAELASYGIGAGEAGTAVKGGMAAKGALGKAAFLAAKREAVAGMVGGAGASMQDKDASLGSVATGALAGGALGFAGGAIAPYAGAGLSKLKGAKSWLTLSDEAVEKTMQAERKVDTATPFIKRGAAKAEEAKLLTQPLNEIDDVIHAPPASDAVPLSDKTRKKLKDLGFSDSYANNVHEMSHADAVDAYEALDMAHAKDQDRMAPDPARKTGEPLAKVINAVQDARKEAGAALDGYIDAIQNTPVSMDSAAEYVNDFFTDRGIGITVDKRTGKAMLDFSQSKFAGPAASADRAVYEEAFEVATSQGQAKALRPKQIRTARQRLYLTAQKAEGPASVPFDSETKVFIDGLRRRMDEPLQALSPEYAAASKRYAKATQAITEILKYLGSKFAGKEEERIVGRLAELLPRELSNAGEASAMAVDDLLRAAKEIGVDPALLRDPKRLVIFNEGLDDIFDITPKRSLAGQVTQGIKDSEAAGTFMALARRDYVGLAERAYGKIVGPLNLRQRKALREALEEKIAQGGKNMAETPILPKTPLEPESVVPKAEVGLETPSVDTSKFERASGLSPENQALEDAAYAKIEKEQAAMLEDYKVKKGNVVNPDDFKPYFKDVGYAGHNSAGVQEPSSYMAKQAWAEGLKGEGEYATLYAGGSGTGKTSAIKDIPEIQDVKGKSAVVWDGNLSNYGSAVKKIQQAVDAGKKVPIIYVYRDPMESFTEGVVKRSLTNPDEMGRLVPSKVVAGNHIGSWEVVNKLKDEGHTVFAIDNSHGWDAKANKSKAKLVPFESLREKVKYPSEAELTAMLDKEAKRLLDEGTITPEQYLGYTGKKAETKGRELKAGKWADVYKEPMDIAGLNKEGQARQAGPNTAKNRAKIAKAGLAGVSLPKTPKK